MDDKKKIIIVDIITSIAAQLFWGLLLTAGVIFVGYLFACVEEIFMH